MHSAEIRRETSATRDLSTQTSNSRASSSVGISLGVSTWDGVQMHIDKKKVLKTFVRHQGHPSARLRKVRPVSPQKFTTANLTPKKVPMFPSPKKLMKAKPKVDTKGIFITHFPSPQRRINHGLPRVEAVSAKIDNRGIDVEKFRQSMVDLRGAVQSAGGQGHQGHSQGQNKTLAHVGKRLT